AAELPAIVEALVRQALGQQGAALGARLSHTQAFMEMGLESMQLLQLQALLGERFQQRFDSAFLFRYNNVAAVAAALAGVPTVAAPQAAAGPGADQAQDQDIAIVGLACRLPGGGPDGFWQLLRDGVDGVRDVPANRWWWPSADQTARRFQVAGYVDDIDCFDAGLFRIAPAEAERIDPQQRLLLELSWELFEDAGYDPASLRASATGVWIGACHFDYRDLAAHGDGVSAYTATGTYGSILPNRLSYFYDLKGPSLLIDTACSSSLVALHDAVQSLRRGECSLAIAGGVNLICTPNNTLAFARAGMLSPSGRCHTFDGAADGYIRGEGAGLVLLKPLAQALADGDRIHGVIAGSAVNHGGAANSLTAPNPQAQCDVITQAYRDAGMSPTEVSYVEAHGTGTRLGDPIELAALTQAATGLLAGADATAWQCQVGSVKTHIGHLEGAAGIAGLIKVLLALRHEWLPGNLHFNQLNPHIDLSDSPFRPLGAARAWPRADAPRCAGLSSFGFGGVSAHVLVREFVDRRQPAAASGATQLIPLSAASAAQLRQACVALLAHLPAQDEPRLEDLAWTLQAGRAAMDTRLAIVAASIGELRVSLENYLSGADDARLFSSAAATPAAAQSGIGALASRWVGGDCIDWAALHDGASPRRIGLPTYRFARERYWVPMAASVAQPTAAVLHPLLHRNSSDFYAQRFSTTLTGAEFVLSDHVLKGKRVLPGVAYLEMARAAVAVAAGMTDGQGIRLADTVWLRPVVVDECAVDVHTELSIRPDGEIEFQMIGSDGGDGMVYCQGRATVLADGYTPVRADIEAARQRCAIGHLEAPAFYSRFSDAGFAYGPAFRGVAEVWWSATEAVARLRLPAGVAAQGDQYTLHPSLLDSAVQGSTAALGLLANGQAFALPYAVEGVEIHRPCAASMWALCRRQDSAAGNAVGKLDIDLCDDEGNVCVRMTGLSVRHADLSPQASAATLLWQRRWSPLAQSMSTPAPAYGQRLVLLAGADGAAGVIESRLGARCVVLPASGTLAQRYTAAAQQLWAELHALLATRPAASVLVQLVVAGGGEGATLVGMSGLLKTARIEHSQLVGQVLEVYGEVDAESLAAVLHEAAAMPQATALRYAQGQLSEENWLELPAADAVAPAANPWREKGVYLLTGGAGGLGLIFAREIASKAPGCTLVLTGRGAIDEARSALLSQVSALGVQAVYRQADVADEAQVAVLFAQIRQQFGSLHGIIHGAGVIQDGLLLRKAAPQLDTVFAPKVAGLINLDKAGREFNLDWIVCLASTSGALGNAGQADYGAANAFMDRYAGWRNASSDGVRILTIDWPLWEQGGMRVDDAVLRRMAAHGIQTLPTAAGLAAFYRALEGQAEQVLVLHGLPDRLRAWLAAGAGTVAQAAPVAVQVAGIDQQALGESLRRVLRNLVSRLLKTATEDIDDDSALSQYGLDSISLTELTGRVNDRFGIKLSPTFFFENGTLNAVADQLLAGHASALAKALNIAETAQPLEAAAAMLHPQDRLSKIQLALAGAKSGAVKPYAGAEPIAIIGMSGRYPQAWDLDAFWKNLREGRDSVTEVPAERWDWREYYTTDRTQEGRHYSKWGGFIEG
ncbi:MAG: SDR family NAD(P)-dependent oxidoreductase, partial [Pseudomonadota bacterium]